ncbi:hypothetical protein BHE74_00048557, partial [Ensete ventricosum]
MLSEKIKSANGYFSSSASFSGCESPLHRLLLQNSSDTLTLTTQALRIVESVERELLPVQVVLEVAKEERDEGLTEGKSAIYDSTPPHKRGMKKRKRYRGVDGANTNDEEDEQRRRRKTKNQEADEKAAGLKREEKGAGDLFRRRASSYCALARSRSSRYRVGARSDGWNLGVRLGKLTAGMVELESLYSGCCRSSVPGNLAALVAYHVVIHLHHARHPC